MLLLVIVYGVSASDFLGYAQSSIDFLQELLYNVIFRSAAIYKKFATNIETLLCSEHISYKSTRNFLKKLPTLGLMEGSGKILSLIAETALQT